MNYTGKNISKDYSDIIDNEPFKSSRHPPMSLYNRAAQFSPFAALTGFEESISQTQKQFQEAEDFSLKPFK